MVTVAGPPEAIDLTASVDDETLTVGNPSEENVTVTVTGEGGTERSVDLAAGTEADERFEPGNYSVTGTADGREVLVEGNESFTFTVDARPPIDLNVSVADRNVTFLNPSEEDVTVTATDEAGIRRNVSVPGDENVTERFEPGNYTLTGTADADREVRFDGEPETTVSVVAADPVDLNVSVADRNVTFLNPSEEDVTVTATSETRPNRTDPVPAGENVTERFAPGNYSLTAESGSGRPVTLDGVEARGITVLAPAEPPEPVNLTVTAGTERVAVENPSDVAVTVTAANDTTANTTVEVPAGANVTRPLAAGSYTLTGTAPENRSVLLNGESALSVTVAAPAPASLSVAVAGRNVSVENPNDIGATVAATNETGDETTVPVPAGENVTERFEPGTYSLTASTANGRSVPVEGQAALTVTVERTEPATDLNLTVGNRDVWLANPTDVAATATVANDTGTVRIVEVPAGANVSVSGLDPGDYRVSATGAGEPFTVDGAPELAFTLPPDLDSLSANATESAIEIRNPNLELLTVSVRNDSGVVLTVPVPGDETVFEPRSQLSPGTYTLNASTDDGRSAAVNGRWNASITLETGETPTATPVPTTTATRSPDVSTETETVAPAPSTPTTTEPAGGETPAETTAPGAGGTETEGTTTEPLFGGDTTTEPPETNTTAGDDEETGILSELWPLTLAVFGLSVGGLSVVGRRARGGSTEEREGGQR